MITLKELKKIAIDNNIAIRKLKELVDSGFKLVNEKLDHLTNLIEERLSGRWRLEKRFDAHLDGFNYRWTTDGWLVKMPYPVPLP